MSARKCGVHTIHITKSCQNKPDAVIFKLKFNFYFYIVLGNRNGNKIHV